jgi:carboxymethylenebutenolidase
MIETRRMQYPIVSGYVTIIADDHQLPAFWAHPNLTRQFPGLVFIHDAWGLTPHVRMGVRKLAEAGFYVIAPDLYDGRVPANADEASALSASCGDAGVPRASAALSVLRTHNHCNGKVGVVGWQIGGEIALQMSAFRQDLRAVVVFYARPADYLPMMPAEECPMLGFYGDSDPQIPLPIIDQMRVALAASPGKGEIIVYPGATTGFFNNTLPTFHADHAADAWLRMVDFLTVKLDVPRHTNPQVF